MFAVQIALFDRQDKRKYNKHMASADELAAAGEKRRSRMTRRSMCPDTTNLMLFYASVITLFLAKVLCAENLSMT